ncbi:amino acid adenylation domain-containing protein, partial [Hymenobacter rubripertinctus]
MVSNLYKKLKSLKVNVDLVDGRLDLQAPKGVLNTELLDEIRAHKNDLIDFISTYKVKKDGYSAIDTVPVQSSYLLSSSQRRLWVLSQFEEANAAYNISGVYTFEGELNQTALALSFSDLIARHEILRTVFGQDEEGEVRQYIRPEGETGFHLAFRDVRTAFSAAEIEALVNQDSIRAFDLTQGPLLRAGLYQTEDHKWIFSYVMHHIISDGWSMEILIKELLTLYNTYIKAGDALLVPLRIQYKDYAGWQQKQLSGEALQQHRAWWLNQFDGELPQLELVADQPRPAVQTYSGGIVSRQLSATATQALKVFCQQQGGSLFMGLLTTVNALLYRYTGQEDIILGSPIAGRDHADLQDQIGFYVNTLALRTRFKGDYSFRQLFDTVKQTTLGAYEHQVYPFDELVDALQLERNTSRNPLFDVMVSVQNQHDAKKQVQKLEGLTIGSYERSEGLISKFDLSFYFADIGEAVQVDIEYNDDIYTKETVEQLVLNLQGLLEALVARPDQPISQLDYLGHRKGQLLEEFNNTAGAYPSQATITSLFEEQVARMPDRVAVVFAEQTLTYRQLNERANQLAHYLQATYAPRPDELIGVQLGRSEWLLITILAVLKTGAAYLPIDPAYPAERIAYLLADSQCRLVLDAAELDRSRQAAEAYPTTNPISEATARSLAYVMYTSGSTGQPKGVMVEHTSAVRLVKATNYVERLDEQVLLAAGALCFDATTFEYWSMLLNGGRLVLCAEEVLLSPALLGAEIRRRGVTMMFFTIGWLNHLVDTDIDIFRGLTTILTGGEKLSSAAIHALRQRYAGLQIQHVYGPTENTTFSTFYPVSSDLVHLPIGQSITNSTAYVLDARQQLCGIGIVGEICLGGAGLARGYLHQPALTAEKFIAHPFIAGERLYRTGDLGRWLADGNIEFVGRVDAQIKIRGYRVELGEIEAVLHQYPELDDAVVVVHLDGQGEKTLVAYLVSGQALSVGALRTYLGERLPAYMVPHHYVPLEALPLNSNGKIDRKQLPDPQGLALAGTAAYVAPRTEVEAKLVALWEEILGKQNMGVSANFFELGGHSLKAMRLLSQIHKEFEIKLTIKDLFVSPVLEEQARLIQQAQKNAFASIEPAPTQLSYPVSSSQRRLWVLGQFEESNVAYNMSGVYVFEGELQRTAFTAALDTLLERHENLRTVFRQDEQGEVRQFILPAQESGFSVGYQDLRHEPAQAQTLKYQIKSLFTSPFDFATAPLLRASLYQTADNTWVFGYVMHHIISDGWSMGLLIQELLTLYNAYSRQEANPLAPLRIQFKDYSVWLQEQLSGEALQSHHAWWLNQFEGELPVLDLLTDKVRPAIKTYNGGMYSRAISPATAAGMKALSEDLGGTLFMGVLATVNALLYRYTSQQDIIIGTPIAGREHADLEEQIGFYVNTLALRFRFDGDQNYRHLFEQVKQVVVGAYDHQVYPFGDLVEALKLQRDMSRNPLFDVQVILSYPEHEGQPEQSLSELQVGAYEEEELYTSRFDLVFNFSVVPGDGLLVSIQYNTDLYHADSIERLAGHLESLMADAVQHTLRPLKELNYLGADEQQKLLHTFQGPVVGYPQDATAVALFEKQAAATPQQPAVLFEGMVFSYQELNEKANQLANHLREQYQLGKDDMVGLMVDRSEKMIIGILAVLKAGAAYVPIDPEYPQARKAFIMQDTALQVLITQTDYMFDLPYYSGAVFAIDIELELLTTSVESLVPVSPEAMAYVIYTSGSTGNPKGVGIRHRNLMHSLAARQHTYGAVRSFLLLSSVAFDSSVAGIFGTLCSGGQLCLTSHIDVANVGHIARYIEQYHVSHLLTVPSYYQLLIAELQENENSLEQIIVAGETCPVSLVDYHFSTAALARCSLFNEYGPTECTVWSSVFAYEKGAPIIDTIGRPIANTQVYILDGSGKLVPTGVAGEICVGGAGVADGYLNQPELTAQKFTTNPFRPGEYLYCTGDRGKWLPEGNLVFMGRQDDQVKVRGYRIELGEIESALLGHPAVEFAIVVARPTEQGNSEIVAYLVSGQSLNTSDMQGFLRNVLPPYAVPAYYVQLAELPLTPNGKVDKKKLPDPKGAGMATGVPYEAPRTETEAKFALIWQQILEKEQVGIHDKFFELGGDSIKILRMLSEVKRELNLPIPVADVYKYTTIAELTGHVLHNIASLDQRNRSVEELQATAVAALAALKARILASDHGLDAENIDDIYPMSDIERGMVYASLVNKQVSVYHDQMVRQRHFSSFDLDRFRRALHLMVDKHPILRTAFDVSRFETEVQIVFKHIPVVCEFQDLSHLALAEQEQAIRTYLDAELATVFDVAQAPLWRMAAFALGADQIGFVFQCHHAIIDGWSDALFMTELNNLYLQLAENPLTIPQPLRASYKDFIIQHEVDKKDPVMRGFWADELAGAKRIDLFTNEPVDTHSTHTLTSEELKKLGHLAGNLSTSVKAISLSAYLYLLKVLSQENETLAGIVTNMRPNCEDSDKILGCFLNTIPLRVSIEDTETGSGLITRIHQKLTTLKDYERLSLLEIAQLSNQYVGAENPVFDSFFNFSDFHTFNSVQEEPETNPREAQPATVNVSGAGRTNTYLDLSVDQTGNMYTMSVVLSRQLKSGLSAEMVGTLYMRILKNLMDSPNHVIGTLEYLSESERAQQLEVFN